MIMKDGGKANPNKTDTKSGMFTKRNNDNVDIGMLLTFRIFIWNKLLRMLLYTNFLLYVLFDYGSVRSVI